MAASFTTVGGEPIDNSAKSRLKSSTTHVAVRPRELLYINDPDQLVLAEFPVNPEAFVSLSTLSLLINDQGEPLYQSQNRIGIKAAFLSDASGSVINPDKNQNRKHDDQIHGPIAGVEIEGHVLSRTITDSEGRYVLQWADIPCPLVAYFMDGYATARLESRRFNPRMQSTPYPYYLMKPYSISCIPNVYMVPFLGPWPIDMGTVTVTPLKLDFTVDTVVLSGTAHLADSEGNLIPVEEKTRYKSENQELQTTISDFYDFDGDGTNDTVVKGYWLEETDPATGALTKKFEIAGGDTNGKELLQGVYLSSNKREPGKDAPDFTRLMDWQTNFSHEGLVAAISEEDLRNTDLYVFRLSDGKLISERLGLAANDGTWSDELGASDQNSRFYYHTYLRGYSGDLYRYTQGGFVSEPTFANWQAKSGINPELHQRQSDHLKPGDLVEIVAINRATGYMGSVQTTVKAAGSDGLGRSLSWDIDEIKLLPPNLKIWVERDYDIKAGLEKGAIREDQIIGYEGAALSDDRAIVIYTDWRKPDGTPLPVMENGNEADYGYTGRIAYLSADKTVAADGSYGIAHFAIKPGKHMQVLRLPDGADSKHLYIQVSGEPESGRPIFTNFSQSKTANFESTGVHEGKLEPRPDRFVPFLVPIFDETNTETQRQIYRQLKKDNPEITYEEPKPLYLWRYRPEFQYSIYGFNPRELVRHADRDSDGTDLLNAKTPVVGSADDLIALVYNLDIINYLPLDYFNAGKEKELIFAFGKHEVKAKINEQGRIEFTNLEHLASLDPEDFLTIQLYTNNDSGNVLWEFAFSALTMFPGRNNALGAEANVIEITADDAAQVPQVISAFITGASGNKSPELQALKWSVLGDGTLTPAISESRQGIFGTSLYLPTTVGKTATAYAFFDSDANKIYTPTFKITPGAPYSIQVLEKTGNTVLGGLGEVNLTLKVTDRYGNPVADGTKVTVVAPELKVQGEGVTLDGQTKLMIKGESEAGTLSLTVTAGTVTITEEIFVHDVELAFPDLTNVNVNSSTPLTIQASSGYGNLQGLALDVAVHRGSISEKQVVLDDQGRATVIYEAGHYPGFGQLSAKVAGTSKIHTQEFFVRNVGDYLERNVLVTNGSGTIDVDGVSHAYSGTTNLIIHAVPGEVIEPSLVDIFEPPVYALQDYAMGNQVGSEIKLLDMSSGIDATGRNIQMIAGPDRVELGWALTDGSEIIVPEHSRTTNLNQAGVNFWIRFPALHDATTIVDWDDFGLSLKMTADHRLLLEANDGGTQYSVTSSEELKAGQWHRVSAHFRDGSLYLGLDGEIAKTVVGRPISAPNNKGYALRLQATDELHIAGLKIYDWEGEAKITFAGGGFNGRVTADATGKAVIPIQAMAARLAYTRPYHQPERSLIAQMMGQILIPAAYANNAASTGTQACMASFAPPPADAPDLLIAQAERFMNIALECFVKTKVEEARINYETSQGIVSKAVALVNKELYEGVYETLKQYKHMAVIFANCLDAVVTGENASAVGATCDFITGMLAIGDIRDLLIQAWHYNIGDQNKYDPLVANLAAIGVLADGVQLIPGLQGGGIVINALTTSAKQVAKFFRMIGDAGQRATKLLGHRLGKIVQDKNMTMGMKLEAFQSMLPFIEISASVALIYQEEPRIFRFLAEAISSEHALDNLIDWTKRYIDRLESELIVAKQQVPSWLNFLIPSAHADISNKSKQAFIDALRKILNGVPGVTEKEIAESFNAALNIFLNALKDGRFALKDVKDDMVVLRAFIAAKAIGGENAIRKLAFNKGWTLGLHKDLFPDEAMLKAIAGINIKTLVENGVENAQKGLQRLLGQLDHELGFQVVKGHMAHILVIADMLKRNDITLVGIEVLEQGKMQPLLEQNFPIGGST